MPTDREPRREWTPEEQAELDRTVRALSLSGILDWESRIDALEKPGRRLIEPPPGVLSQ